MNPEDQQNRIDDFLRGRAKDPDQFARDLESDPRLREETDATRLAFDAIRVAEDQQLKDRLRRLEAGLAAPAEATVIPLRPSARRNWLGYVAAAAMILFLLGYFVLRPAPSDAVEYALNTVEPFPNLAYVITKGDGGPDPVRAAAYTAYESGDYPAAEQQFNALGSEDPNDRFYLAQSLIAQGKYGAARTLFRELSTAADFNLPQEAAFYEAVARLGLGERGEATAALERISAEVDHPMRAEAATLLRELE